LEEKMTSNNTETFNEEIFSTMTKIKNNLKKREGKNLFPECSYTGETPSSRFTSEQDFRYIFENYDIQNDTYVIKSHRPLVGSLLVKGRSFVNEEVKRYIRPVLFKQTIINGNFIRIVSEIRGLILQNEDKISQANNEMVQFKSETFTLINEKFNKFDQEIRLINEKFNKFDQEIRLINEKFNKFDQEIRLINEKFNKFESDLHAHDKITWSKLYSKQVNENNLIENIEYHKIFITKIQQYALISEKKRIPKIIEIGLGNGTMSIYLSRDKLFDVYGIDNDIDVIASCINNNNTLGGYAKFLLLNIFDLSLLKRKEFDVAFSQGTLEHFNNEDLLKILSKQLEIAKYVIFSVPSVFWGTREIGNERKMALEEWRNLLNFGGFKILNLEYYMEDQHIIGIVSE
jgi:hypothetical protein